MKVITSRENHYIKECVKLKKRKYRDQTGLFVIEGPKMLSEAVNSPNIKLAYIFIEKSLAEDFQLPDNTEVFVLDNKLIAEIADTETPQGIVAVVEKPRWELDNIKKDNATLLLLDGIADPGNMGTIIRTAWAFNVDGILLTKGCVDPYSHKVVRSTMGGIYNIPIFQNITFSDIESFKKKGFRLVGSAVKNAVKYYEYDFTKSTIIIIGNEAHGISEELLAICDDLVTIPINPCVDSLNAGIACGIILSETQKQKEFNIVNSYNNML